jgi:hemerythrin-like domain-containing protein
MLNNFLSVYNKRDVWTDVEGIMHFFSTSVVSHFLKENIIFNALINKSDIGTDKLKALKEIFKEHDELIAEFAKLKETAGKIVQGDDDLAGDFIKNCNKTIWTLLKHAQVEDELIFPEISARFSDADFKVLEAELLKL